MRAREIKRMTDQEITYPMATNQSKESKQPSADALDSDPGKGRSKLFRATTVAAVAVLVAGGIAGGYWATSSGDSLANVNAEGRVHTVSAMDLDVTVKQDGELEAVKNVEIRSEVHGNNLITFLVPEGTRVAQGDTLVQLDSTNLTEEIERVEADLAEKQSQYASALDELDFQRTQNAADLESAQVSESLAKMELERYEQGTYPQKLSVAEAGVEAAETKLRGERQDLQASVALFAKGFVTSKKVDDDREAVREAEGQLERAKQALRVLAEYEYPMELKSRQNRVRSASNNTLRVQDRNRRSLEHHENNVERRKSYVERVEDNLAFKQEQLASCTVTAPSPGLVVYYNDGRKQVAEGEQVHHRQTLILLPDTDQMKAVVRVPENRVSMLQKGMVAKVDKPVDGFQPLEATVGKISVLADSNNNWFNRDSREYPVDLMIKDTPEGLKPGLKVEATVFVDRLKNVLAVPVSCLYQQGEQAFVFVTEETTGGVKPRQVNLGKSNETHASIIAGLKRGERVLELQVGEGRKLLEQFNLFKDPAEAEPDPAPINVASVAD